MNSDVAFELAPDLAGERRESRGLVEQGLGLLHQQLAGTRELQASVPAHEQLGLQVGFDCAHVGARGGLADVQPFGSARDVLFLRDRDEGAQLDEVNQHGGSCIVRNGHHGTRAHRCMRRLMARVST
jgi:hypothetical protein